MAFPAVQLLDIFNFIRDTASVKIFLKSKYHKNHRFSRHERRGNSK